MLRASSFPKVSAAGCWGLAGTYRPRQRCTQKSNQIHLQLNGTPWSHWSLPLIAQKETQADLGSDPAPPLPQPPYPPPPCQITCRSSGCPVLCRWPAPSAGLPCLRESLMGCYTAEDSCPSVTCQTASAKQKHRARGGERHGKEHRRTYKNSTSLGRRTPPARAKGGCRGGGLSFMRNEPDLHGDVVAAVCSDLDQRSSHPLSPHTAVLVHMKRESGLHPVFNFLRNWSFTKSYMNKTCLWGILKAEARRPDSFVGVATAALNITALQHPSGAEIQPAPASCSRGQQLEAALRLTGLAFASHENR